MPKKKKPTKNRMGSIKLRERSDLPSEPEHNRLEDPIVFSLSNATVGGTYCISNFAPKDLERLYKTLGKFEKYKWKDIRSLQRKNGLTCDKKGTPGYLCCQNVYPLGKRFFHFRIDGTDSGKSRVFVAKDDSTLRILLFDLGGTVHPKSHK